MRVRISTGWPSVVVFLRLMHAVGGTEHFIQVGNDRRVAEFGVVADFDFHVAGAAIVVMHDHDAGTGLVTIGMGEVAGHAVFLGSGLDW